MAPYITVIIPVSLTVSVSTIQCVVLSANIGDQYDMKWSMFGDGSATILGALFGSVFGMTVFIGHPAFKQMGAKVPTEREREREREPFHFRILPTSEKNPYFRARHFRKK